MELQAKIKKTMSSLLRRTPVSSISLHKLESSLKGSYSLYPDLAECISTSDAIDMNFVLSASDLRLSTYTTPDIFTLNLHGVYLCPEYDILYTPSRQIIKESISTQNNLDQFEARFFYQSKDTISHPCSIFHSHKNGYYHTLIDNLPRLYLLHHPRFRDIDEILILCSNEPTTLERFYLDKLLPKNARVELVDKKKCYRLENLIFPSFLSRRFSGYLPSKYQAWFMDKVAPQRSRQKGKRIMISRIATHKGSQRCIVNEDQLFAALQPQGFKKYVLEHLTIEDQISLFYDAEAVVAAHGAGLSNTIFSGKIKILELFPTSFILPHYYFLAQSLGHDYRFWCSEETGTSANFKVDVPEVSRIVKEFNLSPQTF